MKISKTQVFISVIALFIILNIFIAITMTVFADEITYQHNLKIYEMQKNDKITLDFYKLPQNGIESDAVEIIELANDIINNINDEYFMLKAIHDWVADNIFYDFDSFNSNIRNENTALSTLKSKRALCSGYSSLTVALLRAAGIPAKYISGTLILDNQVHAWCEAFINGKWIILDTAGDSQNKYENGKFHEKILCKDDYFDIPLKKISDTHKYDEYWNVISENKFRECKGLTVVTIPDGFTGIKEYAFRDCVNITDISFSDSITIIEKGAFYNCVSLKNIDMYSGITHIGEYAFSKCESLINIIISDTVTSIDEYAFWNCNNLTEIILPPSVTEIKDYAFADCGKLTILGEIGSYAEIYATNNSIKFVEIVIEPMANRTPLGNSIINNPEKEIKPEILFDNAIAKPTSQKVFVDEKEIAFDAYNINGYNYFKLRDLAFILSGTKKQFEVGWDSKNNAILLISQKSYTKNGGEMEIKSKKENKTAKLMMSKIYLDGKEIKLTAYNIENYNYFKLRDIGEAFNFGVEWDEKNKAIKIYTNKIYTP
ncbi:MAG: leucine-rich repeat protein [Oscillospiraceae bacterium]|nr:leucine-rich repeat protein [Oscillospiraceae bacterium]